MDRIADPGLAGWGKNPDLGSEIYDPGSRMEKFGSGINILNKTGFGSFSVVDPDPHHFGDLDSHHDPHPHEIKIRIRIWICIK